MQSTTFTLATETPNGTIVRLDIAPMSRTNAEKHANTLRQLSPGTPVMVINLESI